MVIVSKLVSPYHSAMMAKSPRSTKNNKKKVRPPRGIRPTETRTRTPRPLAHMVERLVRPLLGPQGYAHGAIVTKWPDIVGREMARHTQPQRLIFSRDGVSGGTLHLRCDSGAVAIEVQHREPQLIERINAFFGYRAVTRLKLLQGPLPGRNTAAAASSPRPLSPEEAEDLSKTIAMVDDNEIRAALEHLGRCIKTRNDERNRS